MPIGAGKYDEVCTRVRIATQAEGVLVVVFGGALGDGFSCQLPPEMAKDIPGILRTVADDIDKTMREETAIDRE